MEDPNHLKEPSATPEDVASLYSWANLQGAKYRDFSASRAETRERARRRAEQALEQGPASDDAEVALILPSAAVQQAPDDAAPTQTGTEEPFHGAESATDAPENGDLEAPIVHELNHSYSIGSGEELPAVVELFEEREGAQAAHHAAEQAELVATEDSTRKAEEQAAQPDIHQSAEWARMAGEETARSAPKSNAWQQYPAEALATTDHSAEAASAVDLEPSHSPAQTQIPAPPEENELSYSPNHLSSELSPVQLHPSLVPEESPMLNRNPWEATETADPAGKPAWLSSDRSEATKPGAETAPAPAATEDTLQGSRDRLTSRWFALRGIFDAVPPTSEPIPAPVVARPPAMAIFSLAGGVGKTSVAATLGRALSSRGERVLLVDTAAFGLMPFFFGATDQRPSVLRTFSPPGLSTDVPLQMVTLDPEGLGNEGPEQDGLNGEIEKFSRGAGRVIVDLATASGSTTRRILRLQPLILVPLIPDMNSVVSVSSIDAFFEHSSKPGTKPVLPYYVLNQFEATQPLHLDVREVLREQLAERLLPFSLRRTPAMSEALAEGMTIMDYAPNSELAEDFVTLAGWVKSLSAPAKTTYRGVRWSER